MKQIVLLVVVLFNIVHALSQYNNDRYLLYQFDRFLDKPFPELELEDEKGNFVNTTSLKGKTLYVDFWFTQCPPCIKQLPYADTLKKFFSADTNIVFLNICIENIERKEAWKQMVKDKAIGGINLFYARNLPQKVNFIRQYGVTDFPTYVLVNKEMKIVGHNTPIPSEKGLVEWCIYQATKNVKVSDSYIQWRRSTKEVKDFLISRASF